MASDPVPELGSGSLHALPSGHPVFLLDSDPSGAKAPVLLLHGGIFDHASQYPLIALLAPHFRVLAPDTRGHGRSPDPGGPFSYGAFAEDAAGLLDSLGLSGVPVVGFSDGGDTALLLALRRPDLVGKLVLVGTPYSTANYHPGILDRMRSMTAASFAATLWEPAASAWEATKAHYSSEAAVDAFFSKLVNDMWLREPDIGLAELAAVDKPALVLHGEKEPYFPVSASKELADALRGECVVVPGAGHACHIENLSFAGERIMRFLIDK
ncbi:Alpha/Beta hydrolase protein [Hyaloraphidium curvatum]|nr:Alpha/Beta hydrolase protein [Hyaloraphidium curvatum]